ADHWVHQLPGGLFQNVMSHALARATDFLPDSAPRSFARWFARSEREPFPSELRVLIVGTRTSAAVTFSSAARPVQKIARVFGTKCSLVVDFDARSVLQYSTPTLPNALWKLQLPWRHFRQAAGNLARYVHRLVRSDLHY